MLDGRLVRKRSQGSNKGRARSAARRTAEQLLNTSADATWRPGDVLTQYIQKEAVPRIEKARLAPNTVARYRLAARLLAGLCDDATHRHVETLKGYTIIDGTRTKRLVLVLQDLAATHGAETAHQARSVLSKYILDPLVDLEEIVPANPIRGRQIDLSGQHRGNGGSRDTGTSLTREQYWRIVDYLLSRDDSAPVEPSRLDPLHRARNSQHSPAKWAAARDLILLQAGTGLRATEATNLRWDELEDDGITMVVPVTVSKNKKTRKAAVIGEVASHLRRRRLTRACDVYVIAAPSNGSKVWQQRGRDKATASLYIEMATALRIPLLKHSFRGHGWRTTLNSLTAGVVPIEVRAALLGHSEEVNRQHYLDLTDLTAVARAMKRTVPDS